MLIDLEVEFSEISLAGINRLMPDPDRREWMKASLKYYLRRDGEIDSFDCHAFPDRKLYIYPFGGRFRVLYEIDDHVFIWSVSLLARYQELT